MAAREPGKRGAFAVAFGTAARRALLVLLIAGTFVACGLRADLSASAALRKEIQDELHVDASVNTNEFNGKLVVTITFQTRPGGDLDVARERAVAIARVRLPRATRIDVFTRL
jgi:hypothetical protein